MSTGLGTGKLCMGYFLMDMVCAGSLGEGVKKIMDASREINNLVIIGVECREGIIVI